MIRAKLRQVSMNMHRIRDREYGITEFLYRHKSSHEIPLTSINRLWPEKTRKHGVKERARVRAPTSVGLLFASTCQRGVYTSRCRYKGNANR